MARPEEEWPLHIPQPKRMHAPNPHKEHSTHKYPIKLSTAPHNSHKAKMMPLKLIVHSPNIERQRQSPEPDHNHELAPPTTAVLPENSSDPAPGQRLG